MTSTLWWRLPAWVWDMMAKPLSKIRPVYMYMQMEGWHQMREHASIPISWEQYTSIHSPRNQLPIMPYRPETTILDLKVWIDKEEKEDQQQSEHIVMHEFYSKEVSSKCVINARSALSWGSKRTILTQGTQRILLKCSTRLPWETIIGHTVWTTWRFAYSSWATTRDLELK